MNKQPIKIRKEFTRLRRAACLFKGIALGAMLVVITQNITGHYMFISFMPSSVSILESELK